MTELLKVPGGRIEFERAGDGPLVVLNHPFGPRAWGWPLAKLERRATVVALGRMHVEDRTIFFAQPWLPPLLEHIGADRCTLCPWSMSGPGAIAYAAAQPTHLEGLVLVDVAGLGGPLTSRPVPGQPQQRRSAAEWAKIRATSWVHEPGPVRDLVEALDLEGLTRTPEAFQRTMDANRQIAQAPPALELEKVTLPTLVLTGRHSRVMGPDAAQRAVDRLPDARLVVFEESAHALPLEEPDTFQDVVGEFMSRTAAPPPPE